MPVTFPAAQTAGDLNVVVVGWSDNTSTVQSVKDSAGNTYTLAVGPTVGTGIEHNISGPFAVRVNVDYLRTRFVSSSLTVQPQNNIRVTGSLVFRFAAPRH